MLYIVALTVEQVVVKLFKFQNLDYSLVLKKRRIMPNSDEFY